MGCWAWAWTDMFVVVVKSFTSSCIKQIYANQSGKSNHHPKNKTWNIYMLILHDDDQHKNVSSFKLLCCNRIATLLKKN
jgi:G:T/U-mismatch repair DNA glycosylase